MAKEIVREKGVRREQYVQKALRLAKRDGFNRINKVSIGEEIECSDALLYNYFKSVEELRGEVMKRAVCQKFVPIVAAGIAGGYRVALECKEGLRNEAIEYMLENGSK